MRKIILQEWLSLDGFAADKNGGLDFFTKAELSKYSDDDVLKFMESIDTILLGRVTYELFFEFWPSATTDVEVIADKLNGTKKIICSQTLNSAPWGKWPDAEIINGDIINKIRQMKSLSGKDIVLWGSISLAQSLMKESLIDEIQIRICPVLLGGGRSLFQEQKSMSPLRLTDFKKYASGLIFVKYAL